MYTKDIPIKIIAKGGKMGLYSETKNRGIFSERTETESIWYNSKYAKKEEDVVKKKLENGDTLITYPKADGNLRRELVDPNGKILKSTERKGCEEICWNHTKVKGKKIIESKVLFEKAQEEIPEGYTYGQWSEAHKKVTGKIPSLFELKPIAFWNIADGVYRDKNGKPVSQETLESWEKENNTYLDLNDENLSQETKNLRKKGYLHFRVSGNNFLAKDIFDSEGILRDGIVVHPATINGNFEKDGALFDAFRWDGKAWHDSGVQIEKDKTMVLHRESAGNVSVRFHQGDKNIYLGYSQLKPVNFSMDEKKKEAQAKAEAQTTEQLKPLTDLLEKQNNEKEEEIQNFFLNGFSKNKGRAIDNGFGLDNYLKEHEQKQRAQVQLKSKSKAKTA